MAAPAVVVASNSRLSGTDAFRLRNVTFSDDLPDPGVHHTDPGFRLRLTHGGSAPPPRAAQQRFHLATRGRMTASSAVVLTISGRNVASPSLRITVKLQAAAPQYSSWYCRC